MTCAVGHARESDLAAVDGRNLHTYEAGEPDGELVISAACLAVSADDGHLTLLEPIGRVHEWLLSESTPSTVSVDTRN